MSQENVDLAKRCIEAYADGTSRRCERGPGRSGDFRRSRLAEQRRGIHVGLDYRNRAYLLHERAAASYEWVARFWEARGDFERAKDAREIAERERAQARAASYSSSRANSSAVC